MIQLDFSWYLFWRVYSAFLQQERWMRTSAKASKLPPDGTQNSWWQAEDLGLDPKDTQQSPGQECKGDVFEGTAKAALNVVSNWHSLLSFFAGSFSSYCRAMVPLEREPPVDKQAGKEQWISASHCPSTTDDDPTPPFLALGGEPRAGRWLARGADVTS